jgi:hypothetical protein
MTEGRKSGSLRHKLIKKTTHSQEDGTSSSQEDTEPIQNETNNIEPDETAKTTEYDFMDDFLDGVEDLDMTELTKQLGSGLDDLSFLLDDPPEPADTDQRAPDVPEVPQEIEDLNLTRRSVNQRDDIGRDAQKAPVRIELNPRPKLDARLRRYRRQQDGTVTAGPPDSIPWSDYENYQVDETNWARNGEGLPLVAATGAAPPPAPDEGGDAPALGATLFYFDRADLVESTYANTSEAIEAEVEKGNQNETNTWKERQNEIQQMGYVLIPHPTTGTNTAGETVELPPGEYPLNKSRGYYDEKIVVGQQAPFSPIVKYGTTYAAISPDPIWAIRRDEVPEDEEQGAGHELSAKKITDLIAASPRFQLHLQAPGWLSDDQIHYVTQDQLGAALVLNRFTESPEEIASAKKQNEAEFELSRTTNGYHGNGHLFIKKSRRGTGVEYHEATHRLSHPAVKHVFGSGFNEGLTEYFTRPLVAPLVKAGEMPPRDSYEPEVQAVDALVKYAGVTEDQLAAAYFTGEVRPLYDQVAKTAVHPPFSSAEPFSLDAYAAELNGPFADEARDVLITACGASPDSGVSLTAFEKSLKAACYTADILIKDRRLPAGTRIELRKLLNRAEDAKTYDDLLPLTTLVDSASQGLESHWATPITMRAALLLASPEADLAKPIIEPLFLQALARVEDKAYLELDSWLKKYNA